MGAETLDLEIKDHLMSTSEEFQRLVQEHQAYERRLEALTTKTYLSEEEKVEEIRLKKKKLFIKDQMQQLISRAKQQRVGAQ
ncbi:MAG: YdcH family protein [Acidobacteria bacterium]|nr:YdcH family protein [Acidobacteriota bacterium]